MHALIDSGWMGGWWMVDEWMPKWMGILGRIRTKPENDGLAHLPLPTD